MTNPRHPRVINIDEVEPMERSNGRFATRARRIAAAAGAKALGVNWMEIPPGKTSFPFHYHTGIEEGIFVLSGQGSVRIGPDTVAVRAGDYVAFLAGPDNAHALTNSGSQPLRYLVLSNQNTTDIVGYPDSKKFLLSALPDPSAWPQGMWVRRMIRDQESVDYFDGEDVNPKA